MTEDDVKARIDQISELFKVDAGAARAAHLALQRDIREAGLDRPPWLSLENDGHPQGE